MLKAMEGHILGKGVLVGGSTASSNTREAATTRWALKPTEDLLVEVEGHVHRAVGVDLRFGSRGLQVVENATLFDAIQKMVRVLRIERLARLKTPHFANHGLTLISSPAICNLPRVNSGPGWTSTTILTFLS